MRAWIYKLWALRIGLWTLFAGMLLAGCQAPVEVDSRVNPSHLSCLEGTFSIGDLPAYMPGVKAMDLATFEGVLVEALTEGLQEQGLRLGMIDQADLIVHVSYTRIPKVDISNTGYSRSRDRNWDMQYPINELSLTVNSYEQGSLIIEIRRRRDNEWIWTGWASWSEGGLAFNADRIDFLVRRVLSQFNEPEA